MIFFFFFFFLWTTLVNSIYPKIYFSGELIICLVNFSFLVLTALKIRSIQMDMTKITARSETTKHHQSEKQKYGKHFKHFILSNQFHPSVSVFFGHSSFVIFVRLFAVFGVVWISESLSYFIDRHNIYTFIFDIWNCLQGLNIFIFMVCKPRVFRLIYKRYVHQIFYSFLHKTLFVEKTFRLIIFSLQI